MPPFSAAAHYKNMFPNEIRRQLLKVEKQTAAKVMRAFFLIQVELEKEIDLLILSSGGKPLSISTLNRQNRLKVLLDDVTDQISLLSGQMSSSVAGSQAAAIEIARQQAAGLAMSSALTFFDSASVQTLIGFSSNEKAVSQLFKNIAAGQRQALFDVLSSGIGTGKSNEVIAKELKNSLNITRTRALTIARTETNRVYRESTRLFYNSNGAGIVSGWRWHSARDLRTCPVCWAMHGRIFSTKTKFATHPNCRCVMVPVFDRKERFISGQKEFAALTPAQQKTILGKGRFELYQSGTRLNKFVEYKQTEFGGTRYLKPISEIKKKVR